MSNPARALRTPSRRQVLKLGGGALAASAIAPLLAACGSASSSGTASVGSNSATGQVTFWTTLTGIYLKAHQHIAAEFNKTHKAQVKVVPVPTTSTTDVSKLLTAVRGGTGPDVYFLDRFTVAQQAATGVLQPLQKYVSKYSGLAGSYLDYAWKEVEFKGQPYGLPFDTDVRGLYYNKTLLQQAGFNLNEMDIKNGPITIDRMRQINQKLNVVASNGNYTRVGVVPWFDQGEGYTWGFDYGGTFANFKQCKLTPTNHGVVEGYSFIYDWAKEFNPGKLASFISAYAPKNAPPSTYPFFKGQMAMAVTGDWQIAAIKEYVPSLDYGITYIPVPKAGDKPTTWSGGFSMVMPQGAKNAAGAWEFMHYACGQAGQRYYTANTSHMPTWKSLLQNKSLFNAEHELMVKHLLPITRSRPPLPVGAKYWDELQTAEQEMELGTKQPTPALQAVGAAVNPQMQRYCPLKG